MQTFLPYPSYWRSALTLDNRRLGKQRVEAMQILQVIARKRAGETGVPWGNHPAVLMWEDYPYQLMLYLRAVCAQWKQRGFRGPKVDEWIATTLDQWRTSGIPGNQALPWWWGDDRLFTSHKAALLRKDPGHYRKFGWDTRQLEAHPVAYWWPNREAGWILKETTHV